MTTERDHPQLDPLSLVKDLLQRVDSKNRYWFTGQEVQKPPKLQRPPSVAVCYDTTLPHITKEDERDQKLAYCIWWEFQFGITPPNWVTKRKENLMDKRTHGLCLEPLEQFWLRIITLDPDMF